VADFRLDELSDKITSTASSVGPSVVCVDTCGPSRLRLPSGLGSGVVVDDKGHVLTNAHLLDGSRQFLLTPPGGETTEARLVGTDKVCDLALLRAEEGLSARAIEFGDSRSVTVGQVVIAIGNSGGSGWTVNMGVVSAVDRATVLSAGTLLDAFIQTDATINTRNSGGPLATLDGRVIGINTGVLLAGEGLGLAIPALSAQRCMAQLQQLGCVRHPWLGIVGQTEVIERKWIDLFELPVSRGVLVTQVISGGPAEKAGVCVFDLVVGLNADEVGNMSDLRERIRQSRVGQVVQLKVFRGTAVEELPLTIDELPEELRRRK